MFQILEIIREKKPSVPTPLVPSIKPLYSHSPLVPSNRTPSLLVPPLLRLSPLTTPSSPSTDQRLLTSIEHHRCRPMPSITLDNNHHDALIPPGTADRRLLSTIDLRLLSMISTFLSPFERSVYTRFWLNSSTIVSLPNSSLGFVIIGGLRYYPISSFTQSQPPRFNCSSDN
ncbi:hypothetical protein KSS87_004600 [Heliosperma pusillum]|nr:hypothetical protein KSS87_004600 [Heliosperma pusillum]